MTPPPNDVAPKVAARDDLYTAMLVIAAGTLLIGIVYLVVRSYQLFGSVLPSGGA
jgi:hypothetical protein